MRQKISPQTQSFIILFSICVLGVFFCLWLWGDLINTAYPIGLNDYDKFYHGLNQAYGRQQQPLAQPAIDTSAWKTHTNTEYNFSFKYKPDWKVLPAAIKGAFKVIEIDPGKKYYNIKIYISPKEFYIFDGLPTKKETIGGATALNVNDALFGIKTNKLFYTFDLGLSMSLLPEFATLARSAKFSN